MSFILSAIGILGMLGTVGSSGAQANMHAQQIRDKIAKVQSTSRNWQTQYAQLLNNEMKLDDQIQADMVGMLKNFHQLGSVMMVEKQNFNAPQRKIQLAGVIFVLVVFFLLLLHQFGLFEPLWHLLSTPERMLWNAITGRGKKKA